jgi:RNA polymerase sigma factor FliA
VYGRNGRLAGERRIDGLTRDEICESYHDRIVLIARRIAERLPSTCELQLDDLVGFGAVGLLEAFERYDAARNILFSTFAEYRVRGAMMDALRQNDSFTRYRRQMSRDLNRSVDDLTHSLGRRPEPEEVADHMGLEIEAYWHTVRTTQPVAHVSIDEGLGGDEQDGGTRPLAQILVGSDGDEPYRNILNRQSRDRLQEAIRGLSARRRQCVVLYYGRGLTLKEIAEVYDVTPSRISLILSSARKNLRETLEDQITTADLAWQTQRGAEAL